MAYCKETLKIIRLSDIGAINNGNWTEWIAIWSEITRVISKSNERAASYENQSFWNSAKNN